MIIKILPIKTKGGIANVVNYVATDKGKIKDYTNQGIFHNLHSTDLQGITKEFQDNYADYGRARVNGNHGLHVILSMSPLDKDKMNVGIMDDIVKTYISKAYPNALSFGTHHQHESHFHSHLVVSSNELMTQKSTRLSRNDLKTIYLDMQRYIKEHHPELSTNIKEKEWGKKLNSEKSYYFEKRNPDIISTKSHLSETVQGIFRVSESSKDFYQKLFDEGLTTYNYKNNPHGIVWGENEKKMRFETLGISQEKVRELDCQNDRLTELENARLEELEEIRSQDDQEEERDLDNDNDPYDDLDIDSDLNDFSSSDDNDLDVSD